MTANDLLQIKLDFFHSGMNSGTVWFTSSLSYFLTTYAKKNEAKINHLRDLNKTDISLAKEYKKQNIPACTLSASFNKYRTKDNIKDLTGLIAIDIDKDNNKDIDVELAKNELTKLPYVVLSMLSCRGEGIWCLIYYNKENDYRETFLALKEDFLKLGYIIDGNCKDETRLRFLSYDKRIVVKKGDIEPYNKTIKLYSSIKNNNSYNKNNEAWDMTKNDIKDIVVAIYLLVNKFGYCSDEYEEWLLDGFRLATMPNKNVGLKLFELISENSENFESYSDVEEKFKECCRTTTYNTNILGYYINRIKEYLGPEWRSRANELLGGKIIY